MKNSEHIDGLEAKQEDNKRAEASEALNKPSLTDKLKSQFASLKQKVLLEQTAEERGEQTGRPGHIPRREALATIGKGLVASLAVAKGIGIKEILAGESNPYYRHDVSRELNSLSELYRIHDLPTAHVQQILGDMTRGQDKTTIKRLEQTLEEHLRAESQNYRIRRNTLPGFSSHVRERSESALHIEGGDDDTVIVINGSEGMDITAYYYPDKNNQKLKGSITITPQSYKRTYHCVTEEIESPGTLKTEVRKLRELLIGENPAIAEAENMIESLDMNSDMVEIAKTLSRISDLSARKDLILKVLNKGEQFLKNDIPEIQAMLLNSQEKVDLGFYVPGGNPIKGISVSFSKGALRPQILSQPHKYYKTSLSLQDIAEILTA